MADSRKRSSRMVGRKIELPSEGVHTEDGFLFHHVGTVNLKSEEIERLYECGINYHQRKRFTPEEDDIVRNNWTEFAEEHNIPYENARIYAGGGDRDINKDIRGSMKRRHFCLETNFWPRMCKGLVHRSGHQVKRRMLIIFDKAIMEGDAEITPNKRNPLSYAELMSFIEGYQIHGNMRTAAEIIKKPLVVCNNSYRRYMNDLGKINRSEWICLWKTVLRVMEQREINFTKALKKAIRRNDNEAIENLSNAIDFKELEPILIRKHLFIKDAWNKLIEKVKYLYTNAYLHSQDKKIAWDEAVNTISCKANTISAEKFSIFLRLLINCTNEAAGYESFNKKYFNLADLEYRMIRMGITGFSVEGFLDTELNYLLNKARLMLEKCEDYIFSKLLYKFRLKERIQMISMAFDRQMEKIGLALPDQTEVAVSAENIRDCTASKKQFIGLRRTPIVEAVILFAKQHDQDWIPPTTLKKYVIDKQVRGLFSEEKNNSALLSRKLLRDYENSVPATVCKRKNTTAFEQELPGKKAKIEVN